MLWPPLLQRILPHLQKRALHPLRKRALEIRLPSLENERARPSKPSDPKSVADLLSEHIWSKMGAEQDACFTVDSIGTPYVAKYLAK